MLIYHGRNYHSASIGVRLVEVVCDKCGCVYFYRLARIGTGTATAHYGIGGDRAAQAAADQARQAMVRRLAEEAELVPCPQCQWINDALIAGSGQGRYLGMRTFGWGIVIVGIAVAVLGAFIVASEPAPAPGALNSFLIGVAVVTSVLAGPAFLLRHFLKKGFQPNRDHPLLPQIPRGTPPPLVRDAATGALERAGPVPQDNGEADEWIDFQIGRSALPPVCCACLSPAAPQSSYQHPLSPAVNLVVPICTCCARQRTLRQWLGALVALGLMTLVGLPVLLALKLDEAMFWFVAITLGLIAPIIGAMVSGRLALPVRVKVVDRTRSVARLWFRNEEYRNQAVRVTV
jgi:hypothetical protein